MTKQSGASKNSDKATLDNRSRQLNQQDDTYWQSRGFAERPPETTPDEPTPSTPAMPKQPK